MWSKYLKIPESKLISFYLIFHIILCNLVLSYLADPTGYRNCSRLEKSGILKNPSDKKMSGSSSLAHIYHTSHPFTWFGLDLLHIKTKSLDLRENNISVWQKKRFSFQAFSPRIDLIHVSKSETWSTTKARTNGKKQQKTKHCNMDKKNKNQHNFATLVRHM